MGGRERKNAGICVHACEKGRGRERERARKRKKEREKTVLN